MAVTHFDAFFDKEDGCDIAQCGTHVGENYQCDSNWDYVTCKKCLKNIKAFTEDIENINKHRSEEDAGYLEYIKLSTNE